MPPVVPPAAIQWTIKKKIVLVFACICAIGFIGDAIAVQIFVPTFRTVADRIWYTSAQYLGITACGVGVLLALRYIGGVRNAHQKKIVTRRCFLHGLGYYLRFAFLVGVVGSVVIRIVHGVPFTAQVGSGGAVNYLLQVVTSAVPSAFTEEIVATVFVYWLLERWVLPGGKVVASTFWGLAAVVVVHLSYHLYYGFDVVRMVAPLFVTALCWRYARSIAALIVGHLVWDIVSLIPTSVAVQLGFWFALGCIGFVFDAPNSTRTKGAVV
ncbi:MAG TPA: CPBP family glutamic-type intramembrane protease [Candidatus Saccharimonas sp.]|nr:CPBP family glutamic-type intramembrane protease [Candidatus Saccharimonas sp.]